jgi:hypothetical protein
MYYSNIPVDERYDADHKPASLQEMSEDAGESGIMSV